MMAGENKHGAEKLNELQRIFQFIELNKDFVLDQYIAYREKVKVIDILRLKLLNNQTTFKHELNLGVLTPDQYQRKVEILNEKLREQELIKSSINDDYFDTIFTGVSVSLSSEDVMLYLRGIFNT